MKVKKISALTLAALLEKITQVENVLFEKIHCVIEEGKSKNDLNDLELLRSVFFAQLQGFYPTDVTQFPDVPLFETALQAARSRFNAVVDAFCKDKQITREDLLQKYGPLYLAYLRLAEALLIQRFYLSRFHPEEKATAQAKALNEAGTALRQIKNLQAHIESRSPQPNHLAAQANEVTGALVYVLKTQKGIALAGSEARQFDPEVEHECDLTSLILKTLKSLPTGLAIDLNKAKDKTQTCLDQAVEHQAAVLSALTPLSSKSPEALIRPAIKAFRANQEKWQRRAKEVEEKLAGCHLPNLSDFSGKLEKISVTGIESMSDGVIAELNEAAPLIPSLIPYLGLNDSPNKVARKAIEEEITALEQAFNQYLKPFAKLKKKYDRYTESLGECQRWLNDLNRQLENSQSATELAIHTYEQACFDLANTHYGLTQFLKPTKFRFLRLFGKCCVIPEPLNSDPAPTMNHVSREALGPVSLDYRDHGAGSMIQIEELNAFNGSFAESESDEEGRQSPELRKRIKPNPRGLMSSPSEELSLLNRPSSQPFRRAFGKPY